MLPCAETAGLSYSPPLPPNLPHPFSLAPCLLLFHFARFWPLGRWRGLFNPHTHGQPHAIYVTLTLIKRGRYRRCNLGRDPKHIIYISFSTRIQVSIFICVNFVVFPNSIFCLFYTVILPHFMDFFMVVPSLSLQLSHSWPDVLNNLKHKFYNMAKHLSDSLCCKTEVKRRPCMFNKMLL